MQNQDNPQTDVTRLQAEVDKAVRFYNAHGASEDAEALSEAMQALTTGDSGLVTDTAESEVSEAPIQTTETKKKKGFRGRGSGR